MSSHNPEFQIQNWLAGLASEQSKKHEAVALAIAKAPTFDERIIRGLKHMALNDPMPYARTAAQVALAKIAEEHIVAGVDIRSYLEHLTRGSLVREASRAVETAAVAPPRVSKIEPEATPIDALTAGAAAEKVTPATPQVKAVSPLIATLVTQEAVAPVAAVPAQPQKPAVPFDQWLLSERNIKLALYAGGLLLLLAGLIFVGVNWAYLPGIAKLGVTLAVTLGMYAGGLVLFQRPALKIGGTALLAIASGFLPLNFVITHIYLTGTGGGGIEPIWLVASLVCGAAYLATALWTKHNLFTVLMVLAVLSGVTAAVALTGADSSIGAFLYAAVALGIVLSAYRAKRTLRVQFMARTLHLAAHVLAPLTFFAGLFAWIGQSGFVSGNGTWFVAFVATMVILAFYVVDDWQKHSLYARWCAAFGGAFVAVMLCTQFEFTSIQTGLVLKLLAAMYLVGGKYFQSDQKYKFGMPLYCVSLLLALFVTAQATLVYTQTPDHLALALVGDVALLALAAFLFRRVEFVYVGAWLLLVPVSIFADAYLADWTQVSLVLSGLMLAYAAAGYFIGQARLKWGGAFLSAAAFLSVLAPTVLIPNYAALIGLLLGIALLYGLFSVWLRRRWLTLAAFAALNLAVLAGVLSVFTVRDDIVRVLSIGLGVLGIALVTGAVELKRRGLVTWRLPFYVVAGFDLAIALGLAGASGDAWVVVVVSVAISVVCFALQWVERDALERQKLPRVLSYLGAVAVLNAVYFATLSLNILSEYVPLVIAASSAVLIGIGVALRTETFAKLYGEPLRYVGLVFSVIAAAGTLVFNNPLLSAIVFGIVSVVSLVLQWVEREKLERLKLPPLLAYFGALTLLNTVYFAARAINILPEYMPVVIAVGSAVMVGIGVALRTETFAKLYGHPLRYVGLLFSVGAAVGTLLFNDPLVSATVYVILAVVSLTLQWVEREDLERLKLPPVLSYLGAAAALNAVFLATRALNILPEYVPVAIAVSSAALVGVGLVLRGGGFSKIFGEPLRHVGLFFSACAVIGTLYFNNPLPGGIVLVIAALMYGADGVIRKQVVLLYASGAALVGASWWLWRYLDVTELQAFAFLLGVLSLVVGWSEARRGRMRLFQLATFAGLVVILGSAFFQSLSNPLYAVLLLIESVLAFAIGVKMRSRLYVEAGILALFGNGLAQFGPAFINLERWIQIGTIGSILLIGGLAALFRRQRLLEVRQTLASEWKQWQP